MSWYDIIKLNQVDAVLAIILDWCDTELDWWRELHRKTVDFSGNNSREEGFSEMYKSIEALKTRFEETEKLGRNDLRTVLLRFLNSKHPVMSASAIFFNGMPKEVIESLNLVPPRQLNVERLINRLEMLGDFQ
jgi:hypothetical protein